ncbi:hypothetical protein BVRB_7g168000 [Beta vulgaris subsp. vulgaris]|nr:hypothetical protein BVRB_7g168000 [Beta vulgaris subsp. vulgaris]
MDPSNNVNEFTDTFPDGEASAQSLLHQPAVGRSEPQGQQFEIREYGVQEAGNMGYSEDLDKAQNNKTTTYLAEKLLDQNLKVSKFSASDGAEKSPCVFFQSAGKTKKRSMLKLNDYPQNSGKYSQSGGHLTEDPPTQNRVDSRRHMSKVPQFGAWEKGDNVGYTIRFENARTIRLSGSSNDPKLNQDMHPPTQAHPTIAKPKPQAAGQHMKEIKFGAWQGGGEVSYTSYFNNVRKNNIKNASKARLERSDAPKEACSKVPQFGAWEGGESVEYTVYFDNARNNKIVGSRPYTFEPQLNDKTNRAQPPNGVTKARVEGTGNQTFGSQLSLYPREEKLQNRTAARRGYPISKVTKSGAWEDGTNFRAYCNVIERDSPVAEQLSLGRGNRKLFDSRVNKD